MVATPLCVGTSQSLHACPLRERGAPKHRWNSGDDDPKVVPPQELERVHTLAEEWLNTLRAMRRECIRSRSQGWSEHEQILYLTLRRGLLLGQAQLRWLGEVREFFASGKFTD